MKTTKKILLSLAACCVLFGLVGCGDKNTNPYEGMTDEEFYYAIFENATYVSDDETERKTIFATFKTDTWYMYTLATEDKKISTYSESDPTWLVKLSNNIIYRATLKGGYEETEYSNFYEGTEIDFIGGTYYFAELDYYASEILNNKIAANQSNN